MSFSEGDNKMKKILVWIVLAVILVNFVFVGAYFNVFEKIGGITGKAITDLNNAAREKISADKAVEDNSEDSTLEILPKEEGVEEYKTVNLVDIQIETNEGLQEAEVTPTDTSSPISSIDFKGVGNMGSLEDLKIADVVENSEVLGGDFAEVYAIDPTKVEFESATVKAIASGNK